MYNVVNALSDVDLFEDPNNFTYLHHCMMDENVELVIKDLSSRRNYKSVDFTISSKLGKGENFTGDIVRALVRGETETGGRETLRVILKTPTAAIREDFPVNVYYVRELFTYNTLLPHITRTQDGLELKEEERIRFAELYAGCTEEGKEVLLFEDVSFDGYQMYDRLQSLDYEHLLLAVKTIAIFHAHSFAVKHLSPSLHAEATDKAFSKGDFGDSFTKSFERWKDKAVDAITDDGHKQKLIEFCGDDAFERLLDMYDLGDAKFPYNIVCHGDCWVNNFLYKYENGRPVKMVMIDWQMNNVSSPVTDLAYLLYSSTDEETRSKYRDEVFETYYQTLQRRLDLLGLEASAVYPKHIFKKHIDEKLVFGLSWSFMLVPIVLSKQDEVMDFNDLVGSDESKGDTRKYSDEIVERLNGVVRDFVKYNYI